MINYYIKQLTQYKEQLFAALEIGDTDTEKQCLIEIAALKERIEN